MVEDTSVCDGKDCYVRLKWLLVVMEGIVICGASGLLSKVYKEKHADTITCICMSKNNVNVCLLLQNCYR